MTLRRNWFVVVVWLLAFSAFAQDGVTVIADSVFLDKTYGATVRLDLGTLTAEELKTISVIDPFGREALPRQGSELTISLIVPKSLASKEGRELAALLEPSMRERFAKPDLEIKLVAIDVGEATKLADQANAGLEQIAESIVEPEGKTLSETMIAANRRLIESLEAWQMSYPRQVAALKRDPKQVDLFFASAIGITSSIAPVWLWLSTTGLNPIGLSQALISVIYDQVNTRFSTRLIRFEAEHKIPVLKSNPVVRFYNETALVKAMAVNFGVNAFAGFSFRSLAWLNDSTHVASPLSVDFLATLGGINLLSGAVTAGSDIGVAKLRRKGYLSARAEILLNSVFNLLAQINNVIVGSGMTEWLPLGLAVEWTGKSAAAILGQALPARGNRFVMIHPDFGPSETAVRYLQNLEDALSSKDLTLESMRGMVQAVDPESPRLANSVTARLREVGRRIKAKAEELWLMACYAMGWGGKTPQR